MARSTLRRADRVSTILDRLAHDGSVDAARLAKEFDVSPATIRRDLQMLEDQKLLARTHGGAVAADVAYELPVLYRGGQHREEKRAIARCAAGPIAAWATDRRVHRRDDDARGGSAARRALRPHRDHQRAQHRRRAGTAPAPQADHDGRGQPHPVVRAGRSARRPGARRSEHRGGRRRRRRDQRSGRPHHSRRDRGAHRTVR